MQRDNRHSGSRRFNKPKYDRNVIKRYKTDIKPDQLSETDVGITGYISNLEGFSGILKARFSDFHVNEIDLDGEVAKFSTTAEPEGFDSNSPSKEVIIPKDTPCDAIPQDIWNEIIAIMGDNEAKVVELDSSSFDKETRGNIHQTVKSIFQAKIVASTITKDGKKIVTFKRFNKADKLDDRTKWPGDKSEYVHFLVYKENVDTVEATFKISDCLRMKASSFSYAGVKDRRGKTTQWFSVRRVEPSKLLRRTKYLRNIQIGNIVFKDEPLKLGRLQGNRFRIALRNITADDDLINNAMESLKQNGFINYYGLQRFGNDKEVPTYEIGNRLLLGKFKEACDLILKCKKCDNPLADISKAKKLYSEGDAAAASKLLKESGNCVESKLLMGLANSNVNDYVNALEKVPRNVRLLYIHAFQALVWNRIVSRRIKDFGLRPVVGDLVVIKDDEAAEIERSEIETEESTDLDDGAKTEENENEDDDREKRKTKNVKILTEDDVKNYSIYDVVLPLPGYDVTYPESAAKEWYKTILEEYGLSLEMSKQSVKTYTLSGTYRNIVRRVTDLSWRVMHYTFPSGDLIRSDYEEFLGKPEPEDQPDGQYKALIIDFCLKSSSYATMVVREILKTDTSTSAHTKLNDYHAKKDTKIAMQTEPVRTIDSPAPDSLLSDPAKYEDFKKSIFGVPSAAEDSLKRKRDGEDADDVVPEKKSKEEGSKKEGGLKLEAAVV